MYLVRYQPSVPCPSAAVPSSFNAMSVISGIFVLRDKAGNETSVHITVNGTHTFEDGVCVHCGASDPDYVPEPTEDTNIPDITLIALNEDGTAADGQDQMLHSERKHHLQMYEFHLL